MLNKSHEKQQGMELIILEQLVPQDHLLRKIDRMVSFDFIYDLLAPYYPATGRPSIDPASMFKMLLIGYLYGIKSGAAAGRGSSAQYCLSLVLWI